MATAVNIVQVTREGVEDGVVVTPNGAFTIPANDGNVIVEVINPTGGALEVSFTATAELAGLALPPLEVEVLAGETRWVGPLPPAVYNGDTGAVAGTSGTGLQLRGLRI